MAVDRFIFHDNETSDGERVRGIVLHTAHDDDGADVDIQLIAGWHQDVWVDGPPDLMTLDIRIDVDPSGNDYADFPYVLLIEQLPGHGPETVDITHPYADLLG